MKSSPSHQDSRQHQRRRQILRWRPLLWRWHRRAGLLAALILVLVAVTGVLLNHTAQLELGKRSIRAPWLLSLYGLSLPELTNFRVDGRWLSGTDNGYLYLDGRQVAYCQGPLVGVASAESLLVAACARELVLLTATGEVVERLGETYGLPVPVQGLGHCQAGVCLQLPDAVLRADLQQLQWTPTAAEVTWSRPADLPAPLRRQLVDSQVSSELSWERLLLDLHSGRIGGDWGVWLVDAAALILLFLSGSGFWLWWQQPRRRG